MSSNSSVVDINWDVREIAAAEHPKNQRLIELYDSKKPADGLPGRDDFDMLDLKDVITGLFIVEEVPEDEGLIRYRLVGSEIEQRTGVEPTGRNPDMFGAALSAKLKDIYRRIWETGEKVMLRGHILGLGIEHIDYEMVFLPIMARDGKRKGGIASMFAFN